MTYNPHIHHRRSIRLKGYDYSQAGAYFITLCTYNREHLFGKIMNGNIILNEFGKITCNEWARTPQIRLNVSLDVFVIMPNHMHGIIIINGRGKSHSSKLHSPMLNDPPILDDSPLINLPNNTNHSYSENEGECDSPLRSPSNTIGAIVRGYKSAVTKQINLLGPGGMVWQRSYYEHIIRNEGAYQTISEYIINNPLRWESDKFYS